MVVLWDGFETMVLPRRVVRRLRVTRLFYRSTWLPWSRLAYSGFSGRRLEAILGVFGPLSLLFLIFFWVAILVFGFGLVHWALGSEVSSAEGGRGFLLDLYLSGTTFFTLGLGDVRPVDSVAKLMTVIEAGMGFGFLALVIGYFPALSQSFSRRESSISKLDSRAGSPPVGVLLLHGHNGKGGADELREQLLDWEQWSAELLESHLSYPVLAYYRSQHEHQSWLAALTAVMDMSTLVLAGIEGVESRQAELTFAMARHTVVDIAAVFNLPPRRVTPERLDGRGFAALQAKDFATAQKDLEEAVSWEAQPTIADVYPLATADLEAKPMNPAGFWFIVKAAMLAQGGTQQQILDYGKKKYTRYHGSDQGWDDIVNQAKASQSVMPP